jgi:ribosomal-protein-alanine N-acetyltransferase
MIETERLKLVPCTGMHLASLQRSKGDVESIMGAATVTGWLAFPESVDYALKMLSEHTSNLRWGMHLVLHKADNKIIGTCGYNGMADEEGVVEIGYAIAPSYKNQGLESEAAKALIDNAFEWAAVKMIDVHTLAERGPSVDMLEGMGFTKIDEDDGLWQWRILRADYEKARAA